jgi:putative aldouronate transport system permease protein
MYINGGLIPYFILIKNVGLYRNFLVYIIPLLFSSFNAIIMMTFFKGLSAEIEESAKMDGANDLRIFLSIVLPVSKAVIATIILFNAVWQWNSWFDSMIFGGSKLVTLQYKLVQIIRDVDATKKLAMQNPAFGKIMGYKPTLESVKATAMAVTIIPIILVYPFLQKYFVKGIMIGSLKG